MSVGNRDAIFMGESILHKFKDSALTIQLEAQDPDHPSDTSKVQFSLQNPVTGVSVSSKGLLSWSSDANTNLSISVILTDGCGSALVQQVSLVVSECPCQNFGTCNPVPGSQPGSNEFECHCRLGTSGQLCETDTIDSCTPSPCGHGTCIDKPTDYVCDCGDGQLTLECSTTTHEPSTMTTDLTTVQIPDTNTINTSATSTQNVSDAGTADSQETTVKAPDTTTIDAPPTTQTQKVPDTTTTNAPTTTQTQKVPDTTITDGPPSTQKAPGTSTTNAPTTTQTQKAPDTTTTDVPPITSQQTTELSIASWSSWTRWTECSRTCDYGLQTRQRNCSDNQDTCEGSKTQKEQCILTSCIGKFIITSIL